ncbi:hypothetical protein [Ectothiorhodospira mobilis]|uniref:hypothetical protein n=1 Tax=Ectothiorhodospira mobilis TaxID=195064 RepID=UPI00190449B3|nr:hypothetical protein [Ectothiorhodospira mobilis]
MNLLISIAAMLGTKARTWAGIEIPRHEAPPKPKYGSVKRHRRHAAKRRARRRARRLNHY